MKTTTPTTLKAAPLPNPLPQGVEGNPPKSFLLMTDGTRVRLDQIIHYRRHPDFDILFTLRDSQRTIMQCKGEKEREQKLRELDTLFGVQC